MTDASSKRDTWEVDLPFELPRGVTLETDMRPGAWVAPRLRAHRREAGVFAGEFIPSGFAIYARVFHPARRRDATPVRWRELAERFGTTVHPEMQFTHIVATRGTDHLDDLYPPIEGCLPRKETTLLADLLMPHTTAPARCWFAIWDGFGVWGGREALTSMPDMSEADLRRAEANDRRMQDQLRAIPRMSIPWRDYFLFRGPIEAASQLVSDEPFQSANLWWPDDRAWCVATEIDGNSTYVGAEEACIERILDDERLEALPSSIEHRFDAWGDELNPRPPGMPPRWGMPG